MCGLYRISKTSAVMAVVATLVGGLLLAGCGGSGNALEFLGSPFRSLYGGTTGPTAPGSTGTQSGAVLSGSGDRVYTDPCAEPQTRKFVRISMRNESRDYVHYFLVLIAFVSSETYPEGAVCPEDIATYSANGYNIFIEEGQVEPFGNYCIEGPALIRFHQGGRFRSAGGSGSANLASAIPPAQGSSPGYDSFFGSAGGQVPVPNVILFHNPGNTAEGQALLIGQLTSSPCDVNRRLPGDPDCSLDAFYYVDEDDRIVGSRGDLGFGSARRAPSEIQGTGCECQGRAYPFQVLAPSTATAQTAECNEFFRGGRIEYVFVRDDVDPPYPQLLWRATDSNGARAHDFDARADIR